MFNKEVEESLRVAFYLRVSTEEQVEKYGIPLQRDTLENLIKSKGKLENGKPVWIFAGERYVYIDDGVSGTVPLEERPGFGKLKEDIALAPAGNQPFDVVAVYKIDRFARKLKILLEVTDFFEDNDIEFISANESIDTSTAFGRAILSFLGVIAELERENILERTQAGREQAVKSGVAMGGGATYGFIKGEDKKLTILEEEAKVVRHIFSMFVNERQSAYKIAQYLTDHEVLSPQAAAKAHNKSKRAVTKKNPIVFWRPERVREILKDEIYIGHYYYNKTKNAKLLPKSEWKLSEYR